MNIPTRKYVGRFAHAPNVNTCTGCHQPQIGKVKVDRCGGRHAGVNTLADVANIRVSTCGDFDGNGNEEGSAREISALQRALYVAILAYTSNVTGNAGASMHGKVRP